MCHARIKVSDRSAREWLRSARRIKQCIKYKDLAVIPFLKFFLVNVCRYLLTVLPKQLLIQPLKYLTFSERQRSKAKSLLRNRHIEAKVLRKKVSCDVS